ncbi:hypothetical protein [Desulfurobacterium sp.]
MKTILFGSLTPIHDKLIEAAVEHLGYNAEPLPQPDLEALRTGRELCNKGMCNPVYFTVGNLINFLKKQAQKGVNVEEKYTFVTIGACGPCRFGMYEMEYKKALELAGFKNLKVSLLNQTTFSAEGEIKLTWKLIYSLMKAIMVADIIRDLGYKIRPYELRKGETDEIIKKSTEIMFGIIKNSGRIKDILKGLKQIKTLFSEIKVNYAVARPVVSVIGEFWVQTTESDGNYHIHHWLEEEGAEVKVEPVSGWIDYQLYTEREKTLMEIKVKGLSFNRIKKVIFLAGLQEFYRNLFETLRHTVKERVDTLASQKLLWNLAREYYDPLVTGGEGHLEVAKHIYNVKFRKAHMTLSLKPFGCMPSTQSDGVQSKVMSDYPETIFVSVETSGDSEVNVKSRIQMKLQEAKEIAVEEFQKALTEINVTRKEINRAIKTNRNLQNPFVKLDRKGLLTAERFVRANIREIKRSIHHTDKRREKKWMLSTLKKWQKS